MIVVGIKKLIKSLLIKHYSIEKKKLKINLEID